MRVGREHHYAKLRQLVRDVAAGQGGCVTVEGEPGAGKSLLVRDALAEAAHLGCRVRHGAADELWPRFPLRAVLDCLCPDGTPTADRAAVVDLLCTGGPEHVASDGAQMAAMDRLLATVDRLCADAPLILALDDLQWADDASLLLWQRLARAGARQPLPLLLIAVRRPVPGRRALDRLHAGLGELGAHCLRLDPLVPEETDLLVQDLVGAAPGPRLRGLAAQAGGNPRYVTELVDGLRTQGRIAVGSGRAELVGPEPKSGSAGFLAPLAEQLGFLSPQAHDALRYASLLGVAFTVTELALALERPARDLLTALDEPIRAGLLGDEGDRLRFRHEVVRLALYEAIPGAIRTALHIDTARAFVAAGMPPSRICDQLLAVAGPLEAWALSWLVEYAEALIATVPGPAAELIERAIEQGPTEEQDRDVLEERLAEAALLLRRPESVGLLTQLRDRAEEPDHRASLAFRLISALMIQGDTDGCLKATDQALAETFPSRAWRVRLQACRVLALADLGRLDEAHEHAQPVVAEAAGLDDPLAASEAHHAMAFALYRMGRARESLHHVAQGVAQARQTPAATDMSLLLLANQAEGHHRLGESDVAQQALEEARQLAVRSGSNGRLVGIEARSAQFHYRGGRWDAALADLERAASLKVSDSWIPVLVHGMHALILGHRDLRGEAVAHLDRLAPDALTPRVARRYAVHTLLARALLAERDGRPAQALEALLPVLSEAYAEELLHERHWLLPDVVRLALETGDTATAEAAVEACAQEAAALPEAPGPAAAAVRCRGLFAQDPRLLGEAVTLYEGGSWPLLLGQTLEDLAVARAWHGELPAAREALGRAVKTYEELGARWDIARADARLRTLGVRRGSRTARRKAVNGWEALTPSELKVALLVAEGHSNPEIASELFLSRRTVQTHVSHILGKLQVRSRAEVAREAALQGDDG
ncbi:AAA family ATPase [Streptomyces sp. NPDC000410]|uniref:ATP-binding protein n=1 Tax=Streptomyces sp. NPDC000410 TaxID=3154254 RepID=UPI003330E62E